MNAEERTNGKIDKEAIMTLEECLRSIRKYQYMAGLADELGETHIARVSLERIETFSEEARRCLDQEVEGKGVRDE